MASLAGQVQHQWDDVLGRGQWRHVDAKLGSSRDYLNGFRVRLS